LRRGPVDIPPRQVAAALGGEGSGGEVIAPGPNHSPKDRWLSIKLEASAPDGMVVHSFAGDDPLTCKDYVRERLGMVRWEPSRPRTYDIAGMKESVPSQVATKLQSKPAAYIYQQADGSPYLRVNRT